MSDIQFIHENPSPFTIDPKLMSEDLKLYRWSVVCVDDGWDNAQVFVSAYGPDEALRKAIAEMGFYNFVKCCSIERLEYEDA